MCVNVVLPFSEHKQRTYSHLMMTSSVHTDHSAESRPNMVIIDKILHHEVKWDKNTLSIQTWSMNVFQTSGGAATKEFTFN